MKTLKRKLRLLYAEHVFFADVLGRKDVDCFREMAHYIINEKWYSERHKRTLNRNEYSERHKRTLNRNEFRNLKLAGYCATSWSRVQYG